MKMLMAKGVDGNQVVWTVTAALAFENTVMSMKNFTAIGILLLPQIWQVYSSLANTK